MYVHCYRTLLFRVVLLLVDIMNITKEHRNHRKIGKIGYDTGENKRGLNVQLRLPSISREE